MDGQKTSDFKWATRVFEYPLGLAAIEVERVFERRPYTATRDFGGRHHRRDVRDWAMFAKLRVRGSKLEVEVEGGSWRLK